MKTHKFKETNFIDELENEIWRPIKGYEGHYEVSNFGRVISYKRDKAKLLKSHVNKVGYHHVVLNIEGNRTTILIHQLVAIAFLNHTPCGHNKVINHIDGNKLNNNVSNLEIVTTRQNATTCFRKDKNALSSKYAGVFLEKINKKLDHLID